MIRWAKQDLRPADSIARAIQTIARTQRQGSRSAWSLATTAMLRGKVREALRWRTEGHLTVYRANKATDRLLLAAIDSALGIALFHQDIDGARATIRRGLARHPIAEMPPASRPWDELALVAAYTRDPQLAQTTVSGFEKDLPQLGVMYADARVAYQRALLALATSRYDQAARGFQEAMPGVPSFYEPLVTISTADALDLAGKPDSAILHYEAFIARPDLIGDTQALFRAGAHKRLGELYEAKGETAKAESHYMQFVELWKDADPELQPKVREVRDRLARLRRRQG